ncbi:PAP-associated domain-containing protein [Plasmodiophora brassicae]|nr:hypothetical protein PBRA_000443 [Plasmodiophora brassicae]
MEDGTVLAAFPCAVEVQAENSSAPDTTTPASSEPLRPDKDVVTLGTVCVATPGANLDHHQYQVIRVPEGYLQRPVIFYTVPMPGSYSDTFLGNELLSFVRNTDAQLSIDNVIRDRIRKQVEAHVAACCRQCSLVVSGSTAAGLNLYAPMSNLDLVIVNADPVVLPYRGLETLAAVITSQDAMFFNVFIIANGDGPVLELRVRHHAAIVVHVTWNAPQVSTALAFAMNAQYQYPMFRPLLLYLKYFLFMHGLKFPSTGGLFPALLQTLVLVHLRLNVVDCATSLGRCLQSFFVHYGMNFDYDLYCISVGGEQILYPREWKVPFPQGMLCVDDPLDPTVDLGGLAFNYRAVQERFRRAAIVLLSRVPVGLLDPVLVPQLPSRPHPSMT